MCLWRPSVCPDRVSQSVSCLPISLPLLFPSALFSLSLLCVHAAVSVWGDAAGAPRDCAVPRQPAGEASAGGVHAAPPTFAPGGASSAGCRREPQQRQTMRGHRSARAPLPQTRTGGCPGREGVQPHSDLSRVQTLPGTEDAPLGGHGDTSISHAQWGEHRVG